MNCLCPDYTHPRRCMANVLWLFRLISPLFSFFSLALGKFAFDVSRRDCYLLSTNDDWRRYKWIESPTENPNDKQTNNVRFSKTTAQTCSAKSWLLDDNKIKNRFLWFCRSAGIPYSLFSRRNDCTTLNRSHQQIIIKRKYLFVMCFILIYSIFANEFLHAGAVWEMTRTGAANAERSQRHWIDEK